MAKSILAGLILFSGLTFTCCGDQKNNLALDPVTFNEELKFDHGVLLDVRTPEEYAEDHLKGATLINFRDDTFTDQTGKLDKDIPVYLYCRSGNRSAEAMKVMVTQGFKKVVHLKGGIIAWKSAGLPVDK